MRCIIAILCLLAFYDIRHVTSSNSANKGEYDKVKAVIRGPEKGEPSKGGKHGGDHSDTEAGPSKKSKHCNTWECGCSLDAPCTCWLSGETTFV